MSNDCTLTGCRQRPARLSLPIVSCRNLVVACAALLALGGCGAAPRSHTQVRPRAASATTTTSSSAPPRTTTTRPTRTTARTRTTPTRRTSAARTRAAAVHTTTSAATKRATSVASVAPVALGQSATVNEVLAVGEAPEATLAAKVTSVTAIPSSDYVGESPPQNPGYAVEMTLTNTGRQTFTDDLGIDLELISASGQVGTNDVELPGSGRCAENVNTATLTLAPNQTTHVCIAVSGPGGAPAVKVRFAPGNGLSKDYAEWEIR